MPNLYHITKLSDSPWQAYLSCSETQLYHFHEPAQGLFLAESPNVIQRALCAGYMPVSFLIDEKEMTTLNCADLEVSYRESRLPRSSRLLWYVVFIFF